MPGIVDIRTILFVLSLLTNIRSTKVLSDQKKCGDPECETSMSRVQAIKDYVGPDCRYLNFKTGEEIMVYFKLSRKREDLWAGSKGTDFGYFPMNAVQIEEVFITKEVEVPTKETDFLCLDGGEYTIENEENRLNLLDEGNENRYFYTNEKDSELKMSENEYKGIKEHEEVSPEKYEYDSKSEELHSLDITTHTDSEFKGSKTRQDETIILEEQSRQMLKPVPTQSTWTISGLADWLGLESVGDKEAASTTSEGTEEMTFRHRKIKTTEDSDFEKLNEEVKTELNKEVKIEPKNSGWFRSTLKDLLNYGSEKTGLGVLYKENDPEVYDSSAVSGNIDDHTVSETSLEGDRDSEHRDSEPFESNWFDLELRDVLAFGYSKENKVKEELSVKEKNNHDEEPSVPIPKAQSSLMDEEMGKQTDKTVTSGEENKEQYNKETSKEILGPASSEDEKYEQEENADLNEPATSFPADFADKSVKQDSKPRNQAMENINTKDMTKEPERTSDQSGWYESIGLSDNQPGHKSVKIKCQQESDADNLLPSHSKGKDFDPIVTQTIRDNNQEDPQKYKSFFSISYFTSILNFQGFIVKENINVEHAENELKSGEESSQSKKGHRIVEINKESKEQIRLNDNVIEKILQSSYVNTSEKNILMSSSTTNNNLEIRNKKQANESAQEQMPHNQPGRSKPKYRRASGQCIQLNWNCTLENLEIQGHSNPEEKQIGHILEVKPASLLDVGNLVNSSDNQHYTRKSIYSHEKSGLIKGKPYDGEIAMLDKSEKVNNSQLQGLGIYLDRTSEGGMFGRMNDTNGRCPAIQKQFFSKDPKEYSDAFTQPRDFLSEDVVFLEVSDKDNPVIQEGGEELLSEKNHAKEDNKIKKISTVQAGVNQHFSKDISYLKANIFYSQEVEEDQGSQNAASFSFSSISPQDPLKDANSEEKSRQHESLGFQNFTDKNKNFLQVTQENKNISGGNSMSSSSVQLLRNNKEVKENNPSPQEKYKEATVKEDFSNKDILLPLSGGQNNGDSENVGRDVNLLIDMPPTESKEYLLEHTINSLFSKKKFKEKEIQEREQVFTNARDDKQSFSGQQHEAPLLKFNLQRSSQPGKTINRESRSSERNKCLVSSILNGKSYTPVSHYTDIMKKTRVSDPLSFLQLHSEKVTESNIQDDDARDTYEETKPAEAKPIESVSPGSIEDYVLNNDYYYHGETKESLIPVEGLNEFPQEEAKQRFSEWRSEFVENIQRHSEADAENKLIKQTIGEIVNILSNEGLSSEAMQQEVFQNEKNMLGYGSHILSYSSVTDSASKDEIQDSQAQIDGKASEEKRDLETTGEYFVKPRVGDSSLITTAIYEHGPQKQIESSYFSTHTFSNLGIDSSQVSPSLTSQKVGEQELKDDQDASPCPHKLSDTETISSFQFEESHGKIRNILVSGPQEKLVNHIVPDTKKHLIVDKEVEKLRISAQSSGIVNSEDTKSELNQKVVPNFPGAVSQKGAEDNFMTADNYCLLQKQLSETESTISENTVLHLEVKSETSDTDIHINPNKLSPPYITHNLKVVNHHMDRIPPYSKDGLDMHHLVKYTNGESFAHDKFPLFTNNLNHAEKIASSQHGRDNREKGSKEIESEKETGHKDTDDGNDKKGKEGVVSNLFSKASRLSGGFFENKHKEESTKNTDSRYVIIDQIRVDKQEVDIVGNDFEQAKYEVQSTEAVSDFEKFTIMEQSSEVQVHSTPEKSADANSRNDNDRKDRKDVRPAVQEAEPGFHETVENGKLKTDTESDLKETHSFTDFQDFYSKLTEESKRILQGSKYEKKKLQQIEEELEKLHHSITIFICEDIYRERMQTATSLEHVHKLNTGHDECLKNKTNLLLELQNLVLDIRNKCEDQNAESDKELHNGQHLEAKYMPPENTENKIHTSVKNGQHQLDLKETSPEENLPIQNYVNMKEAEREWLIQIIMHLNDFWAFVTSGFSVIISISKKVIAALPEDMKPGPDLYGFPWEIVICCSLISIFIILLLMCRSYKSIRSRLYVGREKQLANQVAELVEDKCKVLEKFSLCKKEYEELENTLKDASVLQGSTITSDLKTTYKELSSSNSKLKNEIKHLEKELKEEKSKRSEQDDLMVEIQRRADSLENEAKSVQLQIAEAKNTLKVYEINRERLKTSVEDAIEENRHLHESEKQLLQEAEGWGERFSELNEQTKMFECSKTDMEEALRNKESQVKSLTECLLKMKDWSSVVGDNDAAEDSHWENDIKSETENGEHLDEQEKRTVKKLIYAAKLNACLKSMETERNQVYSKLRDENKAKEELAERIESLQREHVLLQSENKDFENEVQKLQQKLKVMTELYQENEMNLHRKLTVEEKERLQKEEKLSKADEKIVHAAEELNTYRQRAKDLEEELERTIRSYENQIMSHEKKAHDNWLSARAAERHLNDIRKENLHNRQQLTEAEFKYDLLEKDPYALDVPVRIFGREHSPYGPSPMGRPSSETRAFLSPPTLLEGPLRLSPVLPGGGGRGSRGPGNTSTYDVGNERREINSDRFSDPHRPPSDTGSLSPPWDRDPRITSSHTGQLYNEQSLPSRRPERFYHPNSGRLSGPAELRNYNMHSFDKADGQPSENNSRMDLSGDGIKEHSNDTNMVNTIEQSLTPEMENLGPAMVPPPLPLLRAPLMPMDPRGPFMRRPGLPFPLVPPTSVYGPREYFPRDFSGLPRPMLPMRGPFPVRPFSQYPPPRAGFLPPPPPPPDNRNELPAEVTHPSTATSTDHQEPQQGT